LRSRYGLSKAEILAAFSALLDAADLPTNSPTTKARASLFSASRCAPAPLWASVRGRDFGWIRPLFLEGLGRRFCRLSDGSPHSPIGLPRHGTQTCRLHFALGGRA